MEAPETNLLLNIIVTNRYLLELNTLQHATKYMWMEHFKCLCKQNDKLTEFHFIFSYLKEGDLLILPDYNNSITERRKNGNKGSTY